MVKLLFQFAEKEEKMDQSCMNPKSELAKAQCKMQGEDLLHQIQDYMHFCVQCYINLFILKFS